MQRIARAVLPLILPFSLMLVSPLAAADARPSVESLVKRAETVMADGSVVPERDLAPLLERIAGTVDERQQSSLLGAIGRLGRADTPYPAAAKAYLRREAPAVLLAVARSKAPSGVRAEAILLLRTLDADDAALDQAIAIAAAAPERDVQFHGRLLADWQRTRGPGAPPGSPAGADAAAREQAALEYLRSRGEPVSAYSLGRAAADARPDVVAALLDAGVPVDAPQVAGATPLAEASGSGCVQDRGSLEDRLATIDLLIARGADPRQRDNGGSTLLVGAVNCPLAVSERLVAAGTDPTLAGDTGFSPLQFALARNRWDIAEFLIGRGARLSAAAIDEIFFERPTDPKKAALLRQATVK